MRNLKSSKMHRGTEKEKRVLFLNFEMSVKLRLSVNRNFPNIGSSFYFVLCGQKAYEKGWSGHRISVNFSICSVSLCIRVHIGLKKSCWAMLHGNQCSRVGTLPHKHERRQLKTILQVHWEMSETVVLELPSNKIKPSFLECQKSQLLENYVFK